MIGNEASWTPAEDAAEYERRLRRKADLYPLLIAAAVTVANWWLELAASENSTATILVGGVVLLVYREVLLMRADHARAVAMWMRNEGGRFTQL